MVPQNQKNAARLFFALWPSAKERAALAAWQPALHELCGGKATRPENLHATLVFLGDVPLDRLEALTLAAREVQGRKFDLVFDLAHYWGHNHIVHAASGTIPHHLAQLVRDLEQSLSRHRFHFDEPPEYKPHITLLRHAKWSDAPLPQMGEVRWRAEDFLLVQSVMVSDGAHYQALEKFPLL